MLDQFRLRALLAAAAAVLSCQVSASDVPVDSPATGDSTAGWSSSFLPLWGSLADKMDVDLPLPLGVSFGYIGMDLKMALNSAELFIGDDSAVQATPQEIDSGNTQVDNYSIKVDALVFPFLSLYAGYGPTSGNVPYSLRLPTSNLLTLLGPTLSQALGGDTIELDENIQFEGHTFSYGSVFMAAYPFDSGSVFAMADISVALTELDVFSTTIVSDLYQYRFGWDSYHNGNRYQLWGGTFKHGATQKSLLPLSDLDLPLLRDVSVSLEFEDKNGYTPLIGGAYQFSPNWLVLGEKRFGGRNMLVGMINYRF